MPTDTAHQSLTAVDRGTLERDAERLDTVARQIRAVFRRSLTHYTTGTSTRRDLARQLFVAMHGRDPRPSVLADRAAVESLTGKTEGHRAAGLSPDVLLSCGWLSAYAEVLDVRESELVPPTLTAEWHEIVERSDRIWAALQQDRESSTLTVRQWKDRLGLERWKASTLEKYLAGSVTSPRHRVRMLCRFAAAVTAGPDLEGS